VVERLGRHGEWGWREGRKRGAAFGGAVAAVDFKASGHMGWVWGLRRDSRLHPPPLPGIVHQKAEGAPLVMKGGWRHREQVPAGWLSRRTGG